MQIHGIKIKNYKLLINNHKNINDDDFDAFMQDFLEEIIIEAKKEQIKRLEKCLHHAKETNMINNIIQNENFEYLNTLLPFEA